MANVSDNIKNKIGSIEVNYIKGIENKKFELDIFPNKPAILVAPNGFGKSSIACAFKSLTSKGIKLDDNNLYKKEHNLPSKIEISFDDKVFQANNNINNIQSQFDFFVINSTIFAKATRKNMGVFTSATASLEIKTIEIISTIPEKNEFQYQYSEITNIFEVKKGFLPNLDNN